MKYRQFLAEAEAFSEMFGKLTHDERVAYPPHKWMYVSAYVTCETEGCIHGTQRVSFMELCDGMYSSWCGNCNTQNFKIVGIFDDGEFPLKPRIHVDPDDPWTMNAEHDENVKASAV